MDLGSDRALTHSGVDIVGRNRITGRNREATCIEARLWLFFPKYGAHGSRSLRTRYKTTCTLIGLVFSEREATPTSQLSIPNVSDSLIKLLSERHAAVETKINAIIFIW